MPSPYLGHAAFSFRDLVYFWFPVPGESFWDDVRWDQK
jgi:hypothetical protein